jgi:hypothetical protein
MKLKWQLMEAVLRAASRPVLRWAKLKAQVRLRIDLTTCHLHRGMHMARQTQRQLLKALLGWYGAGVVHILVGSTASALFRRWSWPRFWKWTQTFKRSPRCM